MHARFAYAGILLLVIGVAIYFYTNFSLSGLTKNGSVYLLPGSRTEIPVTFSLFLYGYYPGVNSTVIGGEVENETTGYLPVNGSYIEVRAYLVQTLGTESYVVLENNFSSPVTVYYGIRDVSGSSALLGVLNTAGLSLSLVGAVVLVLYFILRRYKDQSG